MSDLKIIHKLASQVGNDFKAGNPDVATETYRQLINDQGNFIRRIIETKPSFWKFHRNVTMLATLFNILRDQTPKRGEGFSLDLRTLTFGRIGEVHIDQSTVQYIEKAEYADGFNRERLFRVLKTDFEFHGYTEKTVPIGVLYVIDFTLRDLLENLPYMRPGRTVVDIGSSTGLINQFMVHLGYTKAYMIDIDEAALEAGRCMAKSQGFSEFKYLTPDEWNTIPGDQVDLVHSFRSWAFKYPFEEYEPLFLKCLKPKLRVCMDIKNEWMPAKKSSLVAHARKRIQINHSKAAPRHLFIY